MKNSMFVKSMLVAGFVGSVVACAPGKQSSLELSAQNSGIIGGSPVSAEDSIAKSTVAIVATVVTKDDQQSQFICTGSLLTENVVLTAAHCIPSAGADYKQVSMYVVFNTDLHKIKKSDVRAVVGTVVHPEYGNTGSEGEDAHDLALIKFGGFMAPGYQLANFLDDESLLKPGVKVTLAGYGLTQTDGTNTQSDDRLRKVQIRLALGYGKHEVILDQTRGKGACHGDSGGPAFLEVNGVQYVWGVTSRGAGQNGVDDCSLMSVYTKVKSESSFLDTALAQLNAK